MRVKDYFIMIVTLAIGSYLTWGFLFMPANLFLPEFALMLLPSVWHDQILWKAIVLENWNFWIVIVLIATLLTGWYSRGFWT